MFCYCYSFFWFNRRVLILSIVVGMISLTEARRTGKEMRVTKVVFRRYPVRRKEIGVTGCCNQCRSLRRCRFHIIKAGKKMAVGRGGS